MWPETFGASARLPKRTRAGHSRKRHLRVRVLSPQAWSESHLVNLSSSLMVHFCGFGKAAITVALVCRLGLSYTSRSDARIQSHSS